MKSLCKTERGREESELIANPQGTHAVKVRKSKEKVFPPETRGLEIGIGTDTAKILAQERVKNGILDDLYFL